jgi:type IV secretion system protein VirB2
MNTMKLRQAFTPGVCFAFTLLLAMTFFGAEPAFAQGLTKVTSILDSILGVMKAVQIPVVILAIFYVGFKMLYQKADWSECIGIVIAAIIIASAPDIAALLLA